MMTEMGLRRSTKWSGYQAQHIILLKWQIILSLKDRYEL